MEHWKVLKGTSSARTREDDAMKGLTTIKHVSRKDWERDHEMRSSQDWCASKYDATELHTEGVIAQPKHDWRQKEGN